MPPSVRLLNRVNARCSVRGVEGCHFVAVGVAFMFATEIGRTQLA
jgi:hypothetical protein